MLEIHEGVDCTREGASVEVGAWKTEERTTGNCRSLCGRYAMRYAVAMRAMRVRDAAQDAAAFAPTAPAAAARSR